MKSIDLWNQLISEGHEIVEDRIYPVRDIYIKKELVNRVAYPCRVKFFRNKNFIDWKIIK